MKNPRAFLWIGLCLILFVNVQVWIRDFAPLDAAQATAERQALEQQQRDNPLTAEVPVADAAPVPAAVTPGDPVLTPAVEGEVPTVAAPAAAAAPVAAGERTLNVRTDVLDVDISLRGAALTRADLLLYPVEKGGSVPVRLMRNNGAGDQYLLQTGLAGAGAGVRAEDFPTHIAQFDTAYNGLRLEAGQDELRVPFTWTSPAGVEVVKTLGFKRGSDRSDVDYADYNASTAPGSVAP
jgi:YidC/Oxa1 family membrane protein insertase